MQGRFATLAVIVAAAGMLVGSSQALAATVLIHVIAALPPALLGLVATLVLHVRIADIEAAGNVPADVRRLPQ